MAGTLVRAHDGFLAWRFREAEDYAVSGIAPCLLEVGILLALHLEILLMGLHQFAIRAAAPATSHGTVSAEEFKCLCGDRGPLLHGRSRHERQGGTQSLQ